jgi:hypothetical protein
MATKIKVNGIRVIYDDTSPSNPTFIPRDVAGGTVFTYRAYGTAAQTVEIRGGFPSDAWEDMQQIVVLTVGGTQSAVVQHTWPVLAVQGVAQVKIARGNA